MNSQVEGNRRHDKGARGDANKLNGGFSGPQPHLGTFIYHQAAQMGIFSKTAPHEKTQLLHQ